MNKKTSLLMLIIFLVCFAVYFNALSNGFVYDDTMQILENRWITDVRFIPNIFTSSVWSFHSQTTVSNYYRPVMHLLYMFNYFLFGLTPWRFHMVNIIFHAGVSALVFIITWKLLTRCSSSDQARTEGLPLRSQPTDPSLLLAFAASLLFATHSIHTEAVTWISGLPDLSYTFFCLLSFYFYMRFEDGARGMYWLSVTFFSIATLCKEPALTLPFILIAYDFAFRHAALPVPNTHRTLQATPLFSKRYIPYFIVSGIYLALRFYALGGFSPHEAYVKLSAYGYLINIFPLFAEYLDKLFLPLNLNAFHVFHPISSVFEMKGILSLAVTAAFVALTIKSFQKNRLICFGLLIIALPLLPSLYIPAVGENVFAERYLYFPSFGFMLLAAAGLSWAKRAKHGFVVGLVFILLSTVCYSVDTVSRNTLWKDDYTLFADTVRKSYDATLPHYNLGVACKDLGLTDEAIEQFHIALKLKPDNPDIRNNLGIVYAGKGLIDKAIEQYQIASKLEPAAALPHNNIGNAYLLRGRIDEAIEQYQIALKLDPSLASSYNNLGNAYDDEGMTDKAVEQYQIALKLRPDDAVIHFNLGVAYGRSGLKTKSIEELQAALRIKRDYVEARRAIDFLTKSERKTDASTAPSNK